MSRFAIDAPTQERLLDELARHAPHLSALPGVHHVDVGLELAAGRVTGRLALRIHVRRKRPDDHLAADDRAPEHLGGRPVDVLVTRPSPHVSADDRVDPLVGGVTITNAAHAFGLGTLGAIVFDRADGAPMLLSARHVLFGLDGGPGDSVVQPGGGDDIAVVTRAAAGLDAAVATLHGTRRWSTAIAGRETGVRELAAPIVGHPVAKSGRTTGATAGIVDGVSPGSFTVIPDPAVVAVPGGELCAGGDSGAIWVDRTQPWIGLGLHVAGDEEPEAERAWALGLVGVARGLGIRFSALPAAPVASGGQAGAGQVLNPGQGLTSSDGRTRLEYRPDGDLVLVGPEGAQWSTGTSGHPGLCEVDSTGDLRLRDPDLVVWSAGTGGDPQNRLLVGDAGTAVVVGADGTIRWRATAGPDA